jgi:tRNA1(Val) A37 N6-methylase TrmN6
MTDNFSTISKELSTLIPKDTRKNEGIYFTPKNVRDKVINHLENYKFQSALEPSCGSGEFINDIQNKFDKTKIVGIEYNKTIYNKIKNNFGKNVELLNKDFLEYKSNEKYDLIIGNPPYFVVSQKNKNCMTGRGNIFVLFIYKCLTEHLKEGGIMAFVLPTSFYNCKYYEPCRKYMYKNTTILHLENVSANFIDTAQNTMIMIVKNTPSNKNYFLQFDGNLCINPYYNEILSLKGTTIKELNAVVKTGEVVWNQHKSNLSETEGILLIYSSNIVDNELVLDNLNGEKKQYIKNLTKKPISEPAILVSRGYGNKYSFSFTLVENKTFYGENHVNVITAPNKEILHRIMKSFKDERTHKFIEYYTGNGALSKSEIESILPIF